MAGHVYRGNKPMLRDGFECGTRAGLLVHARLGTPLCGPCASIKAPVVKASQPAHPAGSQCHRGHDTTGQTSRECAECRRQRKRQRVECGNCGDNISNGSAHSHRKRHPGCEYAHMVVGAA